MVQNVLSSLGSDEVNSISDTTESMQVAQILKNKYFDIVTRGVLPEHQELFQLDPPLDNTTPVLMYVPDGVAKIDYIKYFNTNVGTYSGNDVQHNINIDLPDPTSSWATTSSTSVSVATGSKVFTVDADDLNILAGDPMIATSGPNAILGYVTSYVDFTLTVTINTVIGVGTYSDWIIQKNQSQISPPGYEYVTILPLQQFIDYVNTFDPTQAGVQSWVFTDSFNSTSKNFNLYYRSDIQPRFCTVISNYWILFDSLDLTQDTTLQASKTLVSGQVMPVWSMADDFIPDLDDPQFPLLLNEAKALAFFELKQQAHPKAEQEIRRGWSSIQKDKSVVNKPSYFNQLPNFGRTGRWL
jgi:hypothetical protein